MWDPVEGSGWWMLSGASVLGTRSSPTSCLRIKAWRHLPDKIPPPNLKITKLLPQRLSQMMLLFFSNDKIWNSLSCSHAPERPWVGKGSPVVVGKPWQVLCS